MSTAKFVNKGKLFAGEVLTKEFLSKAIKDGKYTNDISKETGFAPSTIRKYLHKHQLEMPKDLRNMKAHNKIDGPMVYNNYRYVWYEPLNKRVREHHFVIAEHNDLQLPLDPQVVVHHLNGNKLDNRLENLAMMDKDEHDRYHLIMRNKAGKLNPQEKDFYQNHSISDIIDVLYSHLDKPKRQQLKMYAELTRIVIVRN